MMTQVYIRDVPSHVGREVSIKGWLYNKTHKGRLWFLLVRDGTGVIQSVLFKGNVAADVFETAESLTQESSLQITGTVRRDKRAPGGYELDATGMEVVQIARSYPISPKEHGTSFLMDHRHLWLRSSRQHAILRIRHRLIKAARDFFDGRGFVLVDTPILTPVACEGTTNLFPVKYFDTPAYLSQSGQLYSEASCMAFGKVYCFGPTFRAEKSKTRRHLTEFWMVEPEVAYADLDDIMVLAEEFVSYLVAEALREGGEELSILGRDNRTAGEGDTSVSPGSPTPKPSICWSRRAARHPGERTWEEPTRPLSLPASTGRSWFTAIPPPSRVSTWNRIRRTRTWRSAWTCWRRRDTGRSSGEASGSTTTIS